MSGLWLHISTLSAPGATKLLLLVNAALVESQWQHYA